MNIEVIARLRQLEREDGHLDPEGVINDARDDASPLHSYFEWNDAQAAHEHRLSQARRLIRSVKIEVVVRNVPMNVLNYVRDDGGYQAIAKARNDADRAREVVVDEMQRVVSAARRARAVAAFLGTPADIDEIIRIASTVSETALESEGISGRA